MSELNKSLKTTKSLLGELGLSVQNALDAVFAVHLLTYDDGEEKGWNTFILRPVVIEESVDEIEFRFLPELSCFIDISISTKSRRKRYCNPKFRIEGICYNGRWSLVVPYSLRQLPTFIHNYHKLSDGTFDVRILSKK